MSVRLIGPQCSHVGCTKPALDNGLCHSHDALMRGFGKRNPDPADPLEAAWDLPTVPHPTERAA